MPVLDIGFPFLDQAAIPADHGYLVFAAVSRIMPWLVSVGLIVAGVAFGLQSENNFIGRTLWGYALLGMMCLLLGAGFAMMIWWRDSSVPKSGYRHPLE